MADLFSRWRISPTSEIACGRYHFVIVPNDNTDLAIQPRAIRCNVAGNVVLRDAGGTNVTYTVVAGEVLLFRATRVLATGTTVSAGSLVGWY
jgi:hypothetical protein